MDRGKAAVRDTQMDKMDRYRHSKRHTNGQQNENKEKDTVGHRPQ